MGIIETILLRAAGAGQLGAEVVRARGLLGELNLAGNPTDDEIMQALGKFVESRIKPQESTEDQETALQREREERSRELHEKGASYTGEQIFHGNRVYKGGKG